MVTINTEGCGIVGYYKMYKLAVEAVLKASFILLFNSTMNALLNIMHFCHHGGINFSPSTPPIPQTSSFADAHFNVDDESTLARAPPASAHQE